jgi:hypothetical protein
VISLGFNLVGQADGSTGWRATDRTGTGSAPLDPRLGPLQDNGGPTRTHALLAGSPAIAAGDSALNGTPDQRGTLRNRFTALRPGPDIGAFEAQDAVRFRVVAPAVAARGEPFAVTLVALDQWGHLASTYTGTVHFQSTDPQAGLPDDVTFAGADAGVSTVSVTLNTAGPQQLAVNDAAHAAIAGAADVFVEDDGGGPGLAASLRELSAGESVIAGPHSRHGS